MAKISLDSIKQAPDPTWCPGCGDFLILAALQQVLVRMGFDEEQVVLVYGIGCSGNMADFNRCYGFHSLHGRGIPNAEGIKMANHGLKVIVIGGDGDLYGEGVDHFIAGARGNHDITVIAHNNFRYSLTTGQVSPTSFKGTKGKSTPSGVVEKPFNPLATALACHATFVARGYSAQYPQLLQLIEAAISHPGFALVDVLQLCPSFNKEMDHNWFSQHTYNLDESHQKADFNQALAAAVRADKLGLGIYYQDPESVPYHAQLEQLKAGSLLSQWSDQRDISSTLKEFS